MPRLVQFCKGCGEEKVLRRLSLDANGIQQDVDLCQECLIVLMLNNITCSVQSVLSSLKFAPCPGDCQQLKMKLELRACIHCLRNPTLQDYYKKEIETPKTKKGK